ncbi:MAG: amidohydrolase family protein, partial [Armatimonadota bacterium]
MIIDFHAHMGRGPEGSTDLLQSNLPPELIVDRAREAGIDRTVVFPVTYPEYSAANREIADAVARYPDDLIGFARLNPNNPDVLQNLEAAAGLGLEGLKLHHGCDGFELDSAPVHEILDACAGGIADSSRGWPVVFHSIGVVDTLTALAAAHPRTTIVFGHMGGLWGWKAARECMRSAEA